jgi:hypothetical protein
MNREAALELPRRGVIIVHPVIDKLWHDPRPRKRRQYREKESIDCAGPRNLKPKDPNEGADDHPKDEPPGEEYSDLHTCFLQLRARFGLSHDEGHDAETDRSSQTDR